MEPGRIVNNTPHNIKMTLVSILNSRIPVLFDFDENTMNFEHSAYSHDQVCQHVTSCD
ncbi:MAG: hypothetical protein ACI89W_001843 [Gammaproteobacteria bacterium]|jgi:hypothetical protein